MKNNKGIKMNISKILVENVLECDIYGDIVIDKNIIKYCTLSEENMFNMFDTREINIYEFAHKCKEWAIVKGYIIKSEPYDYNQDGTFGGGYFYITRVNNIHSCPNCGANKSEVQAVIDAGEWILKGIK
jgi:hypothetical protein